MVIYIIFFFFFFFWLLSFRSFELESLIKFKLNWILARNNKRTSEHYTHTVVTACSIWSMPFSTVARNSVWIYFHVKNRIRPSHLNLTTSYLNLPRKMNNTTLFTRTCIPYTRKPIRPITRVKYSLFLYTRDSTIRVSNTPCVTTINTYSSR